MSIVLKLQGGAPVTWAFQGGGTVGEDPWCGSCREEKGRGSSQCGYAVTVWVRSDSVGAQRQCGCVATVWVRSDSVGAQRQCGCVATVWVRSDSVGAQRQSAACFKGGTCVALGK